MRKTHISLLLLSALLATAASAADPGASDQRAERRHQLFGTIDADRDGTVSRAEYKDWIDSRFTKLDTNGDGVVSADELASSDVAAGRLQKHADRIVRRYDTSGSGQISKADFEAKEMQRFDRMSDGTDTITEDQFAASRRFRHRSPRAGYGAG